MSAPESLRVDPFAALVYGPALRPHLAELLAPPYDVIDAARLPELQSRPHNVVHLIRPGGVDEDSAHAAAAHTLRRWCGEQVLVDRPPAVYVYEHRSGMSLLRGVVGAVPVGQPAAASVLPHEDVMPEPVADRAALMELAGAQLEPILLTVSAVPELDTVIASVLDQPALLDATLEGTRHRVWPVTNQALLADLERGLAPHSAVIADGHHRFAAYGQLRQRHGEPWDRGLALVVDTARYPFTVGSIARSIAGLSLDAALSAVEDVAHVELLSADLAEGWARLQAAAEWGPALLLAGEDKAAVLTRMAPAVLEELGYDHSREWRELPTALLHEWLIPVRWQLDPRDASRRVSYHHDPADAVTCAHREHGIAVIPPPVPGVTVRSLAARGELLPRKSTSFVPKPPAGLLIRPVPRP